MAEQEKSLVKSSHPLTRYDPKARKELVVRGLNALSEVKDADFYFFKGEEHRMRGELKLAISYYEKALQIDSEHEDSLFWMGWCYSKAISRTVDPKEYKILKTLDAELAKRAAVAFQKLIAIREKKDSIWWGNCAAYYNLGMAQSKLGLYEAAVESYKRAIEFKPDEALAHYNLGWVYAELGCYQDAIESYKQAIRIKPDDADAHSNLGFAYRKLGRYQDAIESYKQAIRIKPTNEALAHYDLGWVYAELGRYQDAIESYKQAIRIKPDDADAHSNLGFAYLMNGDKDLALKEYKILKILDAELANKLFNLIDAK
jgi:tetratricopeptide (TPR) repeat protein